MIIRIKYTTLFCWVLLLPFWAQGQESPLLSSFQAYQKAKKETPFDLQWIPVGPVLNSARVEAVQADPTHPGTMYAAFGSGNLWKTTNNGLSWRAIFEEQAAQGIGDIALAPSNPNIIYVGTGESLRKNRDFTFSGTGVYRSADGGENWTHIGLSDTWHIGEIVVHPEDPSIVFVAAMGKFWSESESMGIYRTLNAGKDWERVLFVDKNTRANDVVISPSNPSIIYASTWENDINAPLSESVYGPNSSVYKSEDGGTTWSRIDNGLPTDPKKGRIGLAVSHQDPNKVYALMDNRNLGSRLSAEVYRSLDGGKQWQKTHDAPLMIFPGIGWYFADIYVNPSNDEEIYGLGVRLVHSKDGGKTFDIIGGKVEHLHPSRAPGLHLDHCELWINPLNPKHLLLGNDGGCYLTYDGGESWLHLNNIPAGEFYDITLDQEEPYRIFGGTQDDATVYGPAKEWDNTQKDVWKYLWVDAWSGGDGCVTQVDPDDPNTVYFSMQNGYMLRKDVAADTSIVVAPRRQFPEKDKLRYSFVTPYFISPHDAKTLYHAGNYVMKSLDRGDHWEVISDDLTMSSDTLKNVGAIGAIAESQLKPGLLYAGTSHGAFWVSQNDGENWMEHSAFPAAGTYLPLANIRSICPSSHQEGRVYMAMTGFNFDDLNTHLFRSDDHGEHWTSLHANLPNEAANVILEDPVHEDILYVGTSSGVYITFNRGQSWALLGPNLPHVSVADLAIQERENELVIATHGRGIYYVSLGPVHQVFAADFLHKKETLLLPLPVISAPSYQDTHKDVDPTSLSKLPISFWAAEAGVTHFVIRNKLDKIVWEYDYQAKAGLNQFRWDLVVDSTSSDLPYFIHYQRYLKRGKYTLEMVNATTQQIEAFELK